MHAPAPATESSAAPRLVGRQLACQRGGVGLFTALDFALAPGEVLDIEGANGSGKTTLLRVVCGLRPPDAGTVFWDDADIAEDPEPLRRALTFVGHAAGVKRDLTARENLQAALAIAGGTATERCERALERVGLAGHAERPVRGLSAGQTRRLSLARLLLRKTPLWVLDEPLSALDRAGKALLEALIIDHCGAGGMALLTTHQPADFGPIPVQSLPLGQ